MRSRTSTTCTCRPSGRSSGLPRRSGWRGSMADAAPAAPLLLASTSPQRRAILEQLGIPFDVVEPRYEEGEIEAGNALRFVQEHAQGKARSVLEEADGRPVVGVDTAVV